MARRAHNINLIVSGRRAYMSLTTSKSATQSRLKELPFVMGVLGRFHRPAGTAAAATEGPQVRGSQSRQLRQVLESMKPHLAFSVENKLAKIRMRRS